MIYWKRNNVYDVNVDSNEMQRLNPIEGEQTNAYYVETCEQMTTLIKYSFFNPLNFEDSWIFFSSYKGIFTSKLSVVSSVSIIASENVYC